MAIWLHNLVSHSALERSHLLKHCGHLFNSKRCFVCLGVSILSALHGTCFPSIFFVRKEHAAHQEMCSSSYRRSRKWVSLCPLREHAQHKLQCALVLRLYMPAFYYLSQALQPEEMLSLPSRGELFVSVCVNTT